ncbi:MAG: reverse transcriptase domain-containing protein [Thermomicrobiales bacterium]
MPSDPPHLLTRGNVADLLGLPLHKLTWWVWVLHPSRRYRHFEIGRHSSDEPRRISAPIKPLKDIQRSLADVLSEVYQPPPQVHGFVRRKDPKSNAQAHPGQHWVLRADVADFFGSINFGRVRGMFMAFPFEYPAEVATLLAQICCHENQLPQGAPTSPVVSNLICRGLDKDLARLATSEHCYFTRYADDLCFSTDRRSFPDALARLDDDETVPGPRLISVIRDHGFELNVPKTRLAHTSQRQRITGLVVNDKVNVSRAYLRSLRNLLYIWNRYGEDAAKEAFSKAEPRLNWPPEKQPPKFRWVIQGRIQHVGYIRGWDDPTYRTLALALARVDTSFSPHEAVQPQDRRIRLFTEGPSDVAHLRAALAAFHAEDEFADLDFVIDDNSAAGSDSALLSFCRSSSKVPQPIPCLCLFDSDSDKVLKQAVDAGGWKDWGNNVVAVSLAHPAFRDGGRLCIELLYSDEVLGREDGEGRRVFLRSEFDPETGLHEDGKCYTPHAGSKGSLVIEQVRSLDEQARSLARTKMDFANAVEARESPYLEVDFSGFVPTLDRVRAALTMLE